MLNYAWCPITQSTKLVYTFWIGDPGTLTITHSANLKQVCCFCLSFSKKPYYASCMLRRASSRHRTDLLKLWLRFCIMSFHVKHHCCDVVAKISRYWIITHFLRMSDVTISFREGLDCCSRNQKRLSESLLFLTKSCNRFQVLWKNDINMDSRSCWSHWESSDSWLAATA